MRTEKIIKKLSEILLWEMGKEELTTAEMAKRCGISRRKLCEIISREKKGLMVEILMTICENLEIDYGELFSFDE